MPKEAEQLVQAIYEEEKEVSLEMIELLLAVRAKKLCGLGCDARAYARLALQLTPKVDASKMTRDTFHRLVEMGSCTDSWYWDRGDSSNHSEFIPYKILLQLLNRRKEHLLFDVYRFYRALSQRDTNLLFHMGYKTFDQDKKLRTQLKEVFHHPMVRLVTTAHYHYPKWNWHFSGNYRTFFNILEMFPVGTQKTILREEFTSCKDESRRATLYEYCYGNAQLRDVIDCIYLKEQVKKQLSASREAQLLCKLQPEWITMQ
jgi:hypothetical protein